VAAWTLTGGPAGAKVQQLLEQEGVPALCLPIADDTRENLSVVETATGQEFRFVLPGPTLDRGRMASGAAAARILAELAKRAALAGRERQSGARYA